MKKNTVKLFENDTSDETDEENEEQSNEKNESEIKAESDEDVEEGFSVENADEGGEYKMEEE